MGKIWTGLFFSAQTFTTVGYGHISPVGFLTSALSAAEALIGLLSFAIATGLFFGRFSRPTAFKIFA
jgi:inward rectifier potassium channel